MQDIEREVNLRILKEMTLGGGIGGNPGDSTLEPEGFYITGGGMEKQPVTMKSLVDKSPYLDIRNDARQSSLTLRNKYASNYQAQSLSREGAPYDLPKRIYYCPLTRNKKFQVFLDDLFDLGFDVDRNKKEITDYVAAIEAFFSEKIRDLYLRKGGENLTGGRSKSQLAGGGIRDNSSEVNALMHKNQLMTIFNDAVEDVKK